jgi:hypothetical protein
VTRLTAIVPARAGRALRSERAFARQIGSSQKSETNIAFEDQPLSVHKLEPELDLQRTEAEDPTAPKVTCETTAAPNPCDGSRATTIGIASRALRLPALDARTPGLPRPSDAVYLRATLRLSLRDDAGAESTLADDPIPWGFSQLRSRASSLRPEAPHNTARR